MVADNSEQFQAAANNYAVGDLEFVADVTLTNASHKLILSDDNGVTKYISGAEVITDTAAVFTDTYDSGTITVSVRLYRNTTTYPATPEGEAAWAAYNTADNLRAALGSYYATENAKDAGSKVLRVTATMSGTNLKYRDNTPTKATNGWDNDGAVFTHDIVPADYASLASNSLVLINAQSFFYGIPGTGDDQSSLAGTNLTIVGTPTIVAIPA